VAIFITKTALPITSAGRFWPWGPLGIAVILLATVQANAQAQDPMVAARAYMDCVFTNAAKLDDGRMDSKDLAKLVEPLCYDADVATATAANGPIPKGEVAFDHAWAAVQFYRSRLKRGI
jgi:hypothetical protein